jgi:hypothetical protein
MRGSPIDNGSYHSQAQHHDQCPFPPCTRSGLRGMPMSKQVFILGLRKCLLHSF